MFKEQNHNFNAVFRAEDGLFYGLRIIIGLHKS